MKKLTTEGKRMLSKMKAAGKAWAQDYLGSDAWNDWLWESIHSIRREEKENALHWPDDKPTKMTKKEALRGAKNILIDLTHSLSRDFDDRDILHLPSVRPLVGSLDMADYHLSKEGVDYGEFVNTFRSAAHDVFLRKNTIAWAADELLLQIREG